MAGKQYAALNDILHTFPVPRPDDLIEHNISTFDDILEKSLSPKSNKTASTTSTPSTTLASSSAASMRPSSRRLEPLRANYQLLNDALTTSSTAPPSATSPGWDSPPPASSTSVQRDAFHSPDGGSDKEAASYVCTPSRSGIRLSISKSRSRRGSASAKGLQYCSNDVMGILLAAFTLEFLEMA